jgi:zinc resistance-associated protein
MKTKSRKTIMVCLVAAAVMAMGGYAFAGQGMMQSPPPEQGYGANGHHFRGGYGPYGDRQPNLTPEQRKQMDAERHAFFNATEKIRTDLYAKRLALRGEMSMDNPDLKKALGLQKEISGLKGDLDQKRLKHILAMRKIDPDAGRWSHRGHWERDHRGFQGRGWGQGYGMMGYGPGPGYGNGMRGYGPGMMGYGPGYGYGMMGYGPWMGYGPGYCR